MLYGLLYWLLYGLLMFVVWAVVVVVDCAVVGDRYKRINDSLPRAIELDDVSR